MPSHIAARLVAALGQEDFFPQVAGSLEEVFPHDCLIALLYRRDAAPIALHDTMASEAHRKGLRNFLENTYVLNPFYQAFRKGLAPGLYFMRDLVPRDASERPDGGAFKIRADEMEEIGYLTQGWPAGMQELLLAFPLTDGGLIEISLSREAAKGRLEAWELAPLEELFPLFLSLHRKHWELAAEKMAPKAQKPLLEQRFQDFGAASLSARERDVLRLVLLGHSSASIGLSLNIALPTVKTHRRNAYGKLGITSQAELFALFMQSLQRG